MGLCLEHFYLRGFYHWHLNGIILNYFRNLTLILCLIACGLEGVVQIQYLAAFFIVRFFQGTVAGLFIVLIPVYVR